ncbi:sugar kinase [Streptococcus uberis]|uniref:sugar kinase n=2 Tax=Streptococcus uberis TaxID=1349 RepID=UPI0012B67313|nr:sugar kinase [Streptococcus uberis]MTB97933.1 sugar kinase [Streptococcus uberis]
MSKILFFGEPLIRISPQNIENFSNGVQSHLFYGGSEVNIARTLSGFGQKTKLISAIPENPIGDSFLRFLQSQDIDTNCIQRTGNRMGLYFLENSFGCRQGQVIYDRKESSLHDYQIEADQIDHIFSDVDHFHFSGITLSLGKTICDTTKVLLDEAKKRGLSISFDLNFRSFLIAPEEAKTLFSEFAPYADYCFGIEPLMINDHDIEFFNRNEATNEEIKKRMNDLMDRYDFKAIFHTNRCSDHFGQNVYQAYLLNKDKQFYMSKELKTPVLQRVGSGDAFVAGALYQIFNNANYQNIVDFAVASGTYKCVVEGDNMFESVGTITSVLNQFEDIKR